MKKILATLIGLNLLMIPMSAYAEESKTEKQEIEEINASNLSGMIEPKQLNKVEGNYLDPKNYPLISVGDSVGDLWDSYGSKHSIALEEVTALSDSNEVKIKLRYDSSEVYYKEDLITLELFNEGENILNFVDNIYFDTFGYNRVYLNTSFPNNEFTNQPYVYIRLGISNSEYDDYYSDTKTFKITNPFYTLDGDSPKDQYVVISNESTNYNSTQSTGSFKIDNKNYTLDKKLDLGAYKMDVDLPFDSAKNRERLFNKSNKSITAQYNVGDNKSFWVTNISYNYDYQIQAELAYSGTKADVWVHNRQITAMDAEKLGREFDNKIYQSVTQNFGQESDVNQDQKINILVFDIQDGFSGSGGYVGGYFYSKDLYNVYGSNTSEIFYIDTYPSMGIATIKDVTKSYETIAHEFQHMVNYNQNVLIEGNAKNMDTWLNESLSMAAEQIYTGKGLLNRVNYYNSSASIKNGHSLLYWNNSGDVLSNYSLSYLFGQYIKIQANQGDRIFKEILQDPNSDYLAVENVAKKYIDPNITFGELLTNFRIALLLKEPNGIYGFKGNEFFDSLQERVYTGNSTYLRGGGAIVALSNSNEEPTNKGPDITYTFIKNDNGEVDKTPPVKPSVDVISDADTQISGITEPKATVTAKVNQTIIGSATASDTGNFKVQITKQNAGTIIEVYVSDLAGNNSEPTKITVIDKTPPLKPVVNKVTDLDKQVTGTTEKGSTVIVKSSGKDIGRSTATVDGKFTITIPKQLKNTTIEIVAIDQSGNKSLPIQVKIIDEKPQLERLVGKTRYTTAVAISNAGWKTSNTVFIVNGWAIADGLTATPLASAMNAPILLSKQNSIPDETMEELKRLKAKNIVFIGGTGVISSSLERGLVAQGYQVKRIGGKTRYDTSLMIAQELDKLVDVHTIFMAYGHGEPDALSIAAQAGQTKQPIILTEKNSVPLKSYTWLKNEVLKTTYFVGGKGVIAPVIMNEMNKITSQNVLDNRLSGVNRQETNAKVMDAFYKQKDMPTIMVAHSDTSKLVDALAAGPLAAKFNVPVLLVNRLGLNETQTRSLEVKQTEKVHQIGGGIDSVVLNKVVDLLN